MKIDKIRQEIEESIIIEGHGEYFNGNDLVRYYAKGRLGMIQERIKGLRDDIRFFRKNKEEQSHKGYFSIMSRFVDELEYLKKEGKELKELMKDG